MYGENFFFQAFVYLLAAVISVPVAKRLGLGSVLGYLIAGIAIGPFGLGLIGEEGRDIMHFAEFGVVMMLFLIGLELQPTVLWRMRGPILGLGGLQVLLTTALIMVIGILFGFEWKAALASGMILALSSTAIVLQTFKEKGLLKTDSGQSSFSVLLFQDIAVIPMLVLLPLLAISTQNGKSGITPSAKSNTYIGGLIESLPGWAHALLLPGAVAFIVLTGLFLIRPIFRFIAGTRMREIFTATTLLLVIGIALLMTVVGLSPALGTFLAGVMLANSEYRHELESEIEPFKGLLLGLFFIAVGASVDFQLINENPVSIIGLVMLLIVIKFLVLFILGRVFGMGIDQNLFFAFALSQGGEFAFVLFSYALKARVLDANIVGTLVAAVAISMTLTPLLLLLYEKIFLPRFGTKEETRRKHDVIDEDNQVIIAGFGRFGNVAGRLLAANGIGATVLEYDSDRVELLRKLGLKVFYGDATRLDLLRTAGADKARIIILAIDDPDRILDIVHKVQKHFPDLKILARAVSRTHAYELYEAGVSLVFRDTLESSLQLGTAALRLMGKRAHQAFRAARIFKKCDEKSVRELSGMHRDRRKYLSLARQHIIDLEHTLQADLESYLDTSDEAWDSASRRKEFNMTVKNNKKE